MTAFLKPDDLTLIERLAASGATDTIGKRARLLLLYEEGIKTAEIAEKVDLSPGRVLYWRRRYLKDGMGVFGDAVNDPADGSELDESSKKTGQPSLTKLTRTARKARKSDDSIEKPLKALDAGIERAVKRRKKLKKRMRRAGKKKASKIQDRLKKLNRRIKKAKKVQKSLSARKR